MTRSEWRSQLLQRSEKAGVNLADEAIEKLRCYFELLARWNRKISLTALPLDPPTRETLDRLFVEPLAASCHFPRDPVAWFDLGSGGGSPAIPLKILHPEASLTMVEARVRKAAFLREAVRGLVLSGAFVENARFEATAQARPRSAELVTARAVRLDDAFASSVRQLLGTKGRLLLFRSTSQAQRIEGMTHQETIELLRNGRSFLSIYSNGEQSGRLRSVGST